MFVSTLGKVSSTQRASVARFPRLRLAGLEDMGSPAAAVRSIARARSAVRLHGLGDMGKAAAVRSIARNLPTIRYTMRGLGETSCTIDPVTGGRVCTSGPGATATTPAAT